MGVAFLLRMTVQAELEAGTLVEVPVRGLKVEHKIRLRYPGRSQLSHAARAFPASGPAAERVIQL